jgi:hypothetical protein
MILKPGEVICNLNNYCYIYGWEIIAKHFRIYLIYSHLYSSTFSENLFFSYFLTPVNCIF